eukprot:1906736-Rhodomonas_salina.1
MGGAGRKTAANDDGASMASLHGLYRSQRRITARVSTGHGVGVPYGGTGGWHLVVDLADISYEVQYKALALAVAAYAASVPGIA